MVKFYYSVVLDHTADQVWAVIRLFDRHEWAGSSFADDTENGIPGDTVGAIRRVRLDGEQVCQRLVGHSDQDRSYTYENCETAPEPVRGYRVTVRVHPIVETAKAFVEWWASFDDGADDGAVTSSFSTDHFAKSLVSLRSFMASRNAERVLSSPAVVVGRPPSVNARRSGRATLRLV
jgi:hypothetical protein